MNQPPLNPDGVRAAEELMIRTDRITKINYLDAERIISAYLAAALPEVTSFEELDALPAKSVILDSHGDVSVITETGLFMCDDGDCYELDEVADDLPARVLYRPSEKS